MVADGICLVVTCLGSIGKRLPEKVSGSLYPVDATWLLQSKYRLEGVLDGEEVIKGEQGVVVEDDVHPVGQWTHIGHFPGKAADDFVAVVA